MNEVPDHPDIRAAELTGYPAGYRFPKVINHCLYCGEDITDRGRHIKSFDGLFCDIDCCRAYYEIEDYEYPFS